MRIESEEFFQELYEEWMDRVNENIPLRPHVLSREVERALRVNNQIVTHVHNIRRHLELSDIEHTVNYSNSSTVTTVTNNIGNIVVSEMFQGIVDLLLTTEIVPRNDFEDVKITLSNEEFDNLDKLQVDSDNEEDYKHKECNVCIEYYKKGDKLTRLPCQHIFHEECIENWLCNENVKCPICRNDTRQNAQCTP